MALELVRPWSLESPAIGRLSTTNPLAQKVAALVMPAQGYAIVNGVARPLFPPVAITRRAQFGGYWYAGTSGQYANLGAVRNVASRQRFSIFSTWLSDDGQYNSGDSYRYLVSCRTAGNVGWSWGRSGAAGGGAGGNVTRQALVFQGVAAYEETAYSIESLIETSVGATVSGSTWLTYRNGVQAESKAVGTMSAGGDLYFGVQGPGIASTEWLDRVGITVIFDDVLSAAEMASLHANPAQLFEPRVFPMPLSTGGSSLDLTQTTGVALSGSVSVSGNIQIGTSFDLSQSAAVGLSAAVGVSGDIQIGTTFDLAQTAAVGLTGSTAVTGDLQILSGSLDLTQTASIGLTGSLGTTGDIQIGTSFNLAQTAAVGLSGSIGVTGDIQVGTTFNLAQSGAVGLAASLAVSGDFQSGIAPVVTQAYGNFGWDPRIRPSWKRKELREELEAALDDAPKAVQELVRVPGPDISEAPVREALEVVRTARKHRERAVTRQEIKELHEALETVATFTREREAARQARRRKQQHLLLLS